jgi:hypothetical protein
VKRAIPWVLIAVMGVIAPAAEVTPSGQICVAPIPRSAKDLDHDMPGGKPQKREHQYEFSVSVDNMNPVAVPNEASPRLIEGLRLNERHLVTIRDGGEVIESFWFTFEQRGSTELCLSYTPWYQTWQLDPPRPGASWCGCKAERR